MIVIPMGGLSSRFFNAGYTVPKYQLELNERSLFLWVVESFRSYFSSEKFLFIAVSNQFNPKEFILNELSQGYDLDYQVEILENMTKGQAETVYEGCLKANVPPTEAITIFNIDTIRPNFKHPDWEHNKIRCSYLETFIGSGANWSNVVPTQEGSNKVKCALEKQQASKYCCTGLYHWSSWDLYKKTFLDYRSKSHDSELYVAPMYNIAIEKGEDVRFTTIKTEDVLFCGTPSEYDVLKTDLLSKYF